MLLSNFWFLIFRKWFLFVSGLDPAGPSFQGSDDLTIGLNPTAAQFVDIIHTDIALGNENILGHIDFFPTGYQYQFDFSFTSAFEIGFICGKLTNYFILPLYLLLFCLTFSILTWRKIKNNIIFHSENAWCPEGGSETGLPRKFREGDAWHWSNSVWNILIIMIYESFKI